VSLRDGPLSDIKPPVAWLTAVALIIAAIVAGALFVGDRPALVKSGPYAAVRRVADGATARVGGILAAPVRWTGDGLDVVRAYLLAGSQNRRLRRDLANAQTWRDQAVALAAENAQLRALLGAKTDPPLPMVFARTVADARGPFSNSRLADAGADRKVEEGNPVLGQRGLVGRIVGVDAHASRIMLLTDVQSRTPVLVARTNGRAILTGDGGPNPVLAYLRTHDPLRAGDRILTSGDGGVLPRGLPVGVAVRGLDGGWRVALDSDAAPIDFVRILLFKDFSQVAPPADLAPSVLPSTATEPPRVPAPAVATPPPASPSPAAPP
jgi:rod shape-determining protein MreC